MKKALLLILPIIMFMAACNDSKKIANDGNSNSKEKSKNGTGYLPAQVWEDLNGHPISGATIDAQTDGKSIEVVTTNDKGDYAFEKLKKGALYTFVASKKGYVTEQQDVTYDGTNSLPTFKLKQQVTK